MNPTMERYKSLLENFQNNDLKELIGAFGIEATGRKSQLLNQAINLLKNRPIGFDCQAYLLKIVEIYSKQNGVLKKNNDYTHTIQIQQQHMSSIDMDIQPQNMNQCHRQLTHKIQFELEHLHQKNITGNRSLQQGHRQSVSRNIISKVPTNQHIRITVPLNAIGSENSAITSGYNTKVEQQKNFPGTHVQQQINYQYSQQPKQLIHKIRERSPEVMSQKQKALHENNIVRKSSLQQNHQQSVPCNIVLQVPTNQYIKTTASMDSIRSENNAVSSKYDIKVKQQNNLSGIHIQQQTNYQPSQQPIQLIHKIRSRSSQVVSQNQNDLHENNFVGNSSLQQCYQQSVPYNILSQVPTNQHIKTTALMNPIGSENNTVSIRYNKKVKQQKNLSGMHVRQKINYQYSQQPKQSIRKIQERPPEVMSQKQKALHKNNIIRKSSLQHNHQQSIYFNFISQIFTNQQTSATILADLIKSGINADSYGNGGNSNIEYDQQQSSSHNIGSKIPTNQENSTTDPMKSIECALNAGISGITENTLLKLDPVNILKKIVADYYAKQNINSSLLETGVYRYKENLPCGVEVQNLWYRMKKLFIKKLKTEQEKKKIKEVKPENSTVTLDSTECEMITENSYGSDMFLSFTQKTEILARIKFKKLPFYEDHSEVTKPIALIDLDNLRNNSKGLLEGIYNLSLLKEHANIIVANRIHFPDKFEFGYQMLIRICQIGSMSTEVTDYLPLGLNIQINGKECPLPPSKDNNNRIGTRRTPNPINCTHLLKLSPIVENKFTISWFPDGENYVMALFLVKKLNSNNLLKQLLDKRATNIYETIDYIINKFENIDSDLVTTSINFSLMCPLSKIRMKLPAKSINCDHLQCFDANTFLLMNEQKPTWVCPTCNRPCLYDDIQIQTYFLDVVTSSTLLNSVEEIELLADGTWTVNENIADDICMENIY